jgi:putative colanic acid biosysnthesis UDP-glucose lipid carrier transferase
MTINKMATTEKKNRKAPSVTFVNVRKRFKYNMVKRLFDVVFSSFIIITILSWVIPLISVLIFIDSKSPVFFRQKRVGRFGKTFYCLKFRTMYNNIEADFKQASDDDPRITRLGYFLRKTNIDELPQLFNVLMGDMSIVGPRPHMLKDCRDFNLIVKNYKLRTLVKPGITGLAQIKGFRGPAEDDLSVIQRFKLDIFYVRKASLLFDFSILFNTVMQTSIHFINHLLSLLKVKRASAKDVQLQGKKQIAA